jgi:hypothetical protein
VAEMLYELKKLRMLDGERIPRGIEETKRNIQ